MNAEQLLTLLDSQLIQAAIALLAGSTTAIHRYRKTGRIPLATLPWRALRRTLYALRRRYFTVERPQPRPHGRRRVA